MKALTRLFILKALLVTLPAFAQSQGTGPTPGQWQSARAGGMDFLIRLPANTSGTKAKPSSLMLSLHGCAQKAEDLRDLGNWEGASDRHNMIVVLPKVPNGGVILGCWDYYGSQHDGKNRHTGYLVQLTEYLLSAKSGLNINKNQVYVSGLSSGSGQAMLLGCFRPDLFAGMGLNAGPVIGSESSELQQPRIQAPEVAELCRSFAGEKANDLKRQLTSVIIGDQDYIVSQVHMHLIVDAMDEVYELTQAEPFELATLEGANTRGHGELHKLPNGKPRLSLIINDGLGHAWPSGKGGGSPLPFLPLATQKYVNPNSVNYPMYLAKFFSENNPRD
jgi:poly(3-hydroxybutyrate) depolymerase